MRIIVKILMFLSMIQLFVSCSQKGCPGGMCAPDHYYSSNKRSSQRGLSSKANRVRHVNFGTNTNKFYRQHSSTNSNQSYSIEYNASWNKLNRGSSNTDVDIEAGTFNVKKTKKPKNRALFRAKRYKEPKGDKTEMGLWDPEIQDWHLKGKNKQKKKDTTKDNKGHGIKKLD